MSQHLCHAFACTVPVHPRLLMCPRHWRKVPKLLPLLLDRPPRFYVLMRLYQRGSGHVCLECIDRKCIDRIGSMPPGYCVEIELPARLDSLPNGIEVKLRARFVAMQMPGRDSA
jgi:hypothetical protein